MAGSFNKVLLMGNLTRDPEVKFTAGNQALCKLGLAVNRKYTTSDGQKHEEVTFIDCDAWGKTAEALGKYLTKGRPIFIEGRLKLDQWEKDGQKHSKLKVVVENFRFVDSAPGRAGAPEDAGMDEAGGGGGAPRVQTRPTRPAAPANAGGEIQEEDIPF